MTSPTRATPPNGKSDLSRRYGPAAIVTGATEGIGRAFAEALAEAGLDLVLVARRPAELAMLATDLSARHGVVVDTIALDLTATDGAARVLDRTADRTTGLLVAAAGFGSVGPFLGQDIGSELNMVDLNCRSVVELTHGVAARMAARGRGGIVLFGSLVGFQGAPMAATYAATKGFVQGFAEGLAVELKPQGIDVLSVAPGPVASAFAARAGMTMRQSQTPDVVARGALARLGRVTTVRPGWLAKLLGWSLAPLPRWGRVRVMGVIMQGMAGPAPGPRSDPGTRG